jgi:hypothetical protein
MLIWSQQTALQRDFTCHFRLYANLLYAYIKLEIYEYIPSAHVKLISEKQPTPGNVSLTCSHYQKGRMTG